MITVNSRNYFIFFVTVLLKYDQCLYSVFKFKDHLGESGTDFNSTAALLIDVNPKQNLVMLVCIIATVYNRILATVQAITETTSVSEFDDHDTLHVRCFLCLRNILSD